MKHLSFKILILCILIPPVFYVFSVKSLEKNLHKRYTREIESIYMGDTRPLFNGSIRLKDAINKNIDHYLQSRSLLSWGAKAKITVTTKQGTILYPAVFEDQEASLLQPDPIQIAAENYNLMNEGLKVNVDLIIDHNTLLSNTILAFFICVSVVVLYYYYRSGINKAMQEEMLKSSEIARLLELEKNHTKNLNALDRDREHLTSEINEIKKKFEKEKNRASRNEEEMIQEIVLLEEKLEKNLALQEEQKREVEALKENIEQYEKEQRKDAKQKARASDSVRKRFRTLYKNISVNERAISAFVDLEDDLKIKSEEIIHKLNEDPKVVPIKRKVFGKKGRETVQEVIFAYKGRLYFRKTTANKIEVLAIGTKNTQTKDLEYLNKL